MRTNIEMGGNICLKCSTVSYNARSISTRKNEERSVEEICDMMRDEVI